MSPSLPALPYEIRIGHRGLEHREFDDTYWLNGTRIDDQVYNQELQRIIAHQQVTDEAKIVRELQEQGAKQMQNANYASVQQKRMADMQNSYSALAGSVYGYAALGALSAPRSSDPPPVRPPPSAPPFKLSLKTSPLFGYMRWNFDSPFKPLKEAFLRWAWKHTRNYARTS